MHVLEVLITVIRTPPVSPKLAAGMIVIVSQVLREMDHSVLVSFRVPF